RLLLHDRPALHGPGSSGGSSRNGSGVSDVFDVRPGNVYRFAAVGGRGGFLYDAGRPQLERFLALQRGRCVRDSAAGRDVLPDAGEDSEQSLEGQLQAHLNLARGIGAREGAESAGRYRGAQTGEVGGVDGVEEIDLILQSHALFVVEVLGERQVEDVE